MTDTTYRDIITGPRWAGISSFIKDEAWGRGLELKLDIDKSWLRETVRLEVKGNAEDVNKFRTELYTALQQYQERVARKA